jgi:hypothetical protein
MKIPEEEKKTTRRPRKAQRSRSDESTQVLRERIAARAYELYQERNGRQGDALGDWLEAERQILGQQSART